MFICLNLLPAHVLCYKAITLFFLLWESNETMDGESDGFELEKKERENN